MSYKAPLASNIEYGLVRVGTGITAVDGVISTETGLLNYGFFTDGLQTNPVASQVNIATFSNTGPANGISIVNNTQITVENAGTYTKLVTLVISKTSGGTSDISIWLRYNGVDVPDSRQDLELINTLALIFTSGNFTLDMAAGSNIELCWSSADTTVALTALPAAVTPTRPTGASVKITLTRIS
jgi:hypothetical protein